MIEMIKIKGKEYPVVISYYALKHTNLELEKQGRQLSIDEMFKGSLEICEPLLYYGLVAGARREGVELDISRDEIEFILDECLWKFLELLPKFFPTNKNQELGE